MELLTIQETAEMLRISPVTVRRYIKSRRLPAVRVGRAVRIRREDAENLPVPMESEDSPDLKTPVKPEFFTKDDPLWELVGIGGTLERGEDVPSDVSENKYEYLAEAYEHLHMDR